MKISSRGEKIIKGVISGVGFFTIFVLIVGWFYYFSAAQNQPYIIDSVATTINGNPLTTTATEIVYYGYDIGYNPDSDYDYDEAYEAGEHYYSGSEHTNGIICIYTKYSRWDKRKDLRKGPPYFPLYIIGNVERIYNSRSDPFAYEPLSYMDEIDKGYYKDFFGSYYEY